MASPRAATHASASPPEPRVQGAAGALPPLLDPRIARFLERERPLLAGLVARHGSPLNIVWPHTVAGNAEAMRRVFRRHGVDHAIFYGAKVNKSQALVRAAVAAGAGVDVSSAAELEDALRAGATPDRLCATGPAKTAALHAALVGAGALIAIDSLEELADLEGVVPPERQARVLLRLRPPSEGRSRFGMSAETLIEALRRLARPTTRVAYEGLHVHLGSYGVESRIAATGELAALVDVADALGLATRIVDIGGGLPIRYVAPEPYAAVLRKQAPEHYRNATVPSGFYPYGSETVAADWLEALLSAPLRGGTAAGYLRDRGLQLAVEPGRSLVDQAAISVFRVTRVKPLGGGEAVVFVEGSSFSACETWFDSEFLVDPILVPDAAPRADAAPLRAFIAGHSCLDDDVVTNRWLDFAPAPRAGDLLVYANTAGYQMDLLENRFHRHPLPTRLSAEPCADCGFSFVEDR